MIEHNAEVGRKIIISGGGRCNFTNIDTQPKISFQPIRILRNRPWRDTRRSDFIELVKKHKIEFYEKKLGQLFCRESSRQIVEMLLLECRQAKAEVRTQCSVTADSKGTGFTLETNRGKFRLRKPCHRDRRTIVSKDRCHRGSATTSRRQFGLKIDANTAIACRHVGRTSQFGVSWRVFRSTLWFRPADIRFVKTSCSPIEACRARRYCRSRTTGKKAEPVEVDLLPQDDAVEMLLENGGRSEKLGNFLARYCRKDLHELSFQMIVEDRPLSQFTHAELRAIGERLNSMESELLPKPRATTVPR